MKLSAYARMLGISYKTAYRQWKAGMLDAYQLPTRTIIVRDPITASSSDVALSARVSSLDQKDDLTRQMARLKDYAAAKGYQVSRIIQEIGSGLNDQRPKLLKLFTDSSIGIIVVEHRDRCTRFGFAYIQHLLTLQGRREQRRRDKHVPLDTETIQRDDRRGKDP